MLRLRGKIPPQHVLRLASPTRQIPKRLSKILVYIPCGRLRAGECSADDLALEIRCAVRHKPHRAAHTNGTLCADGHRLLLFCRIFTVEHLGSWLNEVDECWLASCNLSGFVSKLSALTAQSNRDSGHQGAAIFQLHPFQTHNCLPTHFILGLHGCALPLCSVINK